MAKKYDHIHKYERQRLGKSIIYKCALPGCPHYVHKLLAVGKISICWYCEVPFVMTKKSAGLKKPHCGKCAGAPNAKFRTHAVTPETVDNFLETILPGVVDKQ